MLPQPGLASLHHQSSALRLIGVDSNLNLNSKSRSSSYSFKMNEKANCLNTAMLFLARGPHTILNVSSWKMSTNLLNNARSGRHNFKLASGRVFKVSRHACRSQPLGRSRPFSNCSPISLGTSNGFDVSICSDAVSLIKS